MFKLIAPILLFCFIALPQLALAETLATVNGKPITQQAYNQYLKYRLADQDVDPASINRQAVLNEMVTRELLREEAVKSKLDKDPEIAYQIEQLKNEALIQALLAKVNSSKPVTEQAMRKEYESKIGGADLKEYKASHILLKSEAEARAVIAELDGGAVFADVARSKSTGPSAPQGGELGWFKLNQMVPPFAQAVAEMKKGSYTKNPVETQFGWHVIRLEDERKLTPPAYDEVKDQIRQLLVNQQMQQYIIDLQQKAKVEIK